jgi:hypothetical protein
MIMAFDCHRRGYKISAAAATSPTCSRILAALASGCFERFQRAQGRMGGQFKTCTVAQNASTRAALVAHDH